MKEAILNDLNFSSMKHRVLSHARHAGPEAASVSSPDIPNAHRLFFQESMRSMGQTASMFPSSRYLANALTKPIDFATLRSQIELRVLSRASQPPARRACS